MSLSAARSFPPAKGTGGCGGGRREDRRSRRDEQDYNPINTRPVDRENKQGLTGEQIDIVANYFALRTLPEWRIYQHMVEFSPDIPMIRMRRRMIREHDDVLGKTVAFDGTILYLTKRLPEESVTLTSKKICLIVKLGLQCTRADRFRDSRRSTALCRLTPENALVLLLDSYRDFCI
ncbi:piwi-like protein 1 [Corticium candelabrum]|uniref:piwi-like protein 1 n=1 Tax=Corticium candelabrum TaxID=121492 RepID=UPI002E26CD1E|nr:piwi-like protein 1 [Corticium candelabrum]